MSSSDPRTFFVDSECEKNSSFRLVGLGKSEEGFDSSPTERIMSDKAKCSEIKVALAHKIPIIPLQKKERNVAKSSTRFPSLIPSMYSRFII